MGESMDRLPGVEGRGMVSHYANRLLVEPQFLKTPRARQLRQAFQRTRLETIIEQEKNFLRMLAAAIKGEDWSFKSWLRITREAPVLVWSEAFDVVAEDPASVKAFIGKMRFYLGDRVAYFSPRGIIQAGMNCLYGEKAFCVVPEPTRPLFIEYARNCPWLADYTRDLPQMGEAFFTPFDELSGLAQVTADDLEAYIRMFAYSFALRFLPACFMVTTTPLTAEPRQNTVVIAVDPTLKGMRLPLMLVLPKLLVDIENVMREVSDREKKGKTSLKNLMEGEAISRPVVIMIEAARKNPQTWELKISDNGQSILEKALAYSKPVPRENWLEIDLIMKLGGCIKTERRPDGSFCQAITLPIDPFVPPEAVASAAGVIL